MQKTISSNKPIDEAILDLLAEQGEQNDKVRQGQSIGARSCSCILGNERFKALSERCTQVGNAVYWASGILLVLSVQLAVLLIPIGAFVLHMAFKEPAMFEGFLATLGLSKSK